MPKAIVSLTPSKFDSNGLANFGDGSTLVFETNREAIIIGSIRKCESGWIFEKLADGSIERLSEPFAKEKHAISANQELIACLDKIIKAVMEPRLVPKHGASIRIEIARNLLGFESAIYPSQTSMFLELRGESIGSSYVDIYQLHVLSINSGRINDYFTDRSLLEADGRLALASAPKS